jgi:TadE-like protein
MNVPLAASRRHRRGQDPRTSRGQSVVEFALVVPIMVVLLVGIVDLARVYTTALSVESAAREAADYGTTLGAGKWQPGAPMDGTLQEMQKRACVAASNLTDYQDSDGDPSNGCSNPSFSWCITPPGGTCGTDPLADPANPCDSPTLAQPCTVTVTLSYDFHLLIPLHIDFHGVQLGLPTTIPIQRKSTFAMTDIDLSTVPAP